MAQLARRPIVAANWKMHKLPSEARAFAVGLVGLLGQEGLLEGAGVPEIVLCPPFVALPAVAQVLQEAGVADQVALGAQNLHWEPQGAFTGEVSAAMLADAGCRYVIVGHSERRRLFGETDEQVRRKVRSALDAGLIPILCVGEALEERRAGRTEAVVGRQLEVALEDVRAGEAARVVIAYEPVWAIGTGENASPEEAARVSRQVIRAVLSARFAGGVAQAVRVQYGGSVTPENMGGFMARPEIDGALVGGASLKVESFVAIVAAGRRAS